MDGNACYFKNINCIETIEANYTPRTVIKLNRKFPLADLLRPTHIDLVLLS